MRIQCSKVCGYCPALCGNLVPNFVEEAGLDDTNLILVHLELLKAIPFIGAVVPRTGQPNSHQFFFLFPLEVLLCLSLNLTFRNHEM